MRIERKVDESPDLSWLGHYHSALDERSNEFTIDREARGNRERGTFRYFTPGTVEPFDTKASWIPAILTSVKERHEYWHRAMLENADKDYGRMETFNRDQWCMLGIIAKAEVISTAGITQVLRSGGLWGVESDSSAEYLAEVESEQLTELRAELESFGFSKRMIDHAFARVERGE